MSASFPELVDELQPIGHDFVADGELVVLDNRGCPQWHRLQRRHVIRDAQRIRQAAVADPAAIFAFDLLCSVLLLRDTSSEPASASVNDEQNGISARHWRSWREHIFNSEVAVWIQRHEHRRVVRDAGAVEARAHALAATGSD
jgi:hypothetical protein